MRYLITGGCGFLGSNLANHVLNIGGELVVFDNLSRYGSSSNLEWLKGVGSFNFIHGDIRNLNDIDRAIRHTQPEVIFHLAGQVAMTTSLNNPRYDFDVNVAGTFNLLEAVRNYSPHSKIIYSSTNKVYGDLENFSYYENKTRYEATDFENGFDEKVPLDFRSPYGCSKGSADQYMLDFNRNFGLKTVVFRHSSIFGGRQFSTFDQGWIGWFVKQALLQKSMLGSKPFSISGNGKQVRDVLFSDDLIACYFKAVDNFDLCSGQAFNIGGGMSNSISLLELLSFLGNELEIKLNYEELPWRANDQKVFVANIDKAHSYFGWTPSIDKETGIKKMLEWVKLNDFKQD